MRTIMRQRTLKVERLGRVEYAAALEVQKQTERAVLTGQQPDTLLLLEHPHTLTLGRRATDGGIIAPDAALRARGVSVPGDLSIVGFDDIEHATIVTPTLTTVRQPLAEMGRTAVSLLIRLLERQRFETLRVELATRLVVRESTAPPRGA